MDQENENFKYLPAKKTFVQIIAEFATNRIFGPVACFTATRFLVFPAARICLLAAFLSRASNFYAKFKNTDAAELPLVAAVAFLLPCVMILLQKFTRTACYMLAICCLVDFFAKVFGEGGLDAKFCFIGPVFAACSIACAFLDSKRKAMNSPTTNFVVISLMMTISLVRFRLTYFTATSLALELGALLLVTSGYKASTPLPCAALLALLVWLSSASFSTATEFGRLENVLHLPIAGALVLALSRNAEDYIEKAKIKARR